MNFQTAVRRCFLEKYASLEGRASRSEFWFFFLFQIGIGFIAGLLDAVFARSSFGQGPFYIVALLVFFLPNLAAQVRRLHDTGRSGWYLLYLTLGMVVPLALSMAFFVISGKSSAAAIVLLIVTLGVIALSVYFVYLLAARGTQGANAYGEDPLNANRAATARPNAPQDNDVLPRLEKLAELKDRGILTDEEFASEKALILGAGKIQIE
jgi:uncharacterized membrane protein YhaH (DUF805 family)